MQQPPHAIHPSSHRHGNGERLYRRADVTLGDQQKRVPRDVRNTHVTDSPPPPSPASRTPTTASRPRAAPNNHKGHDPGAVRQLIPGPPERAEPSLVCSSIAQGCCTPVASEEAPLLLPSVWRAGLIGLFTAAVVRVAIKATLERLEKP
ncbi:hypothetical protein MTO96_043339 [Rhipicephalus appendiculatus]